MSKSSQRPNRKAEDAKSGSQIPIYEQIKRELTERILMGRWLPGDTIPGEVQLAQEFSVSVGTVRRALVDLSDDGFVTRRPKTGTVVTGRTPHHNLRNFFQYFRFHDLDGGLLRSTARIVDARRVPVAAAEAALLNVEPGTMVVQIERVRSVEARPVMWERLFVPAFRLPDFSLTEIPELLYISLFERYGIRISAIREQLSAERASGNDAEQLCVEEGTPLLVIDEIAYDQLAAPVLCAQHRAITDRYRYVKEVS